MTAACLTATCGTTLCVQVWRTNPLPATRGCVVIAMSQNLDATEVAETMVQIRLRFGVQSDSATQRLPGRPSRDFVRDIFGNPFRPVTFDPRWRTSDVLGLARAIYDDRAFDRMPILADALMDAGCADEQVLGHCRGDGPHVRGCWVVDLVLGKE